ncbi:Uncharacterized protein TCM_005205 [Theobroma cacao]|uniref:Uncharacterized protein n=1 Tax=Theobroma cacao TaxID=3641 RepID=A0A061DUP7_THECC|nr:Uncharacterized protein TCM_005205 [Theobroma cacao]
MMGGVGWKRMFVHVGQERPSRYPLTSSFSKTPPTHKPLYVIATEFPFFPSRLGEATFLSIRCKPTLLRAWNHTQHVWRYNRECSVFVHCLKTEYQTISNDDSDASKVGRVYNGKGKATC